MKAGLNLYSIRNFLETEESFLETAHKLKDMGYSYLQYSGGPFEPERIRRVSEASGLPVYLTHVPLDRILNDTDALMEDHKVFGCTNIGLGSIPTTSLVTDEACYEIVDKLEKVGAYMESKGFRFYLHHHHYEFVHLSTGQTVFDYIVEKAPHINFTLDTYWLQYGGVNILSTINKLQGRIGCVHLKDYKVSMDTTSDPPAFAPLYTCVGDGNIDFKAVIPACLEAGAQYFFVEQDNAALLPDTLNQVERSIRYIQAEL